MKIDLSQFRDTFLQECADRIDSMESGLLQLRSAPDDVELLKSIFRAAHSIKGGAGSFGMHNLAQFTHSLENLLDRLRSLEMEATDEVIDVLLRSVDVLRGLLQIGPDVAMPPAALRLGKRIMALIPEDMDLTVHDACELPVRAPHPAEGRLEIHMYKVEFRPHRDMFASGTNPIVLLRNLAALGTASCCHLHDDELPGLSDLDPSQCYLSWTIELLSTCDEGELRDVFEFVEHLAEICIDRVDAKEQLVNSPDRHPAPATVLTPRQEPTKSSSRVGPSAANLQRTASLRPAAAGESSSIQVAIDKVDCLIDIVGELVIAHAMTAQMVETFELGCLPRLREAVASMERNTRELHKQVMGIRMLPVGRLFQRYVRTVYDIAKNKGKLIRLELRGEDTEIDKSMLESLSDPLTHLVRNAADHGIESVDVRKAANKLEEGVITLRAFHRSGRIVIEVSDDGAGIDIDRVRSKAIERGLIGVDSQLNPKQICMLVFEPGFSTQETISELSGRGVGLDVVKNNVQLMNGTVALTSEKGCGTTVTIELPLTLAILEGLLVRVGDQTLVIPLLSVSETVPLREEQIIGLAGKCEALVIRGLPIPLFRLSRFPCLPAWAANDEPHSTTSGFRRLVVIVESGGRRIGLVVDELLGQQQVVVKSLERHLHKIDGIMGATILSDGRVTLIVDTSSIGSSGLFSPETPIGNPRRTMTPD
jgi:two-component system chemotaxis sensor kinase CheA